MPTPPDPGRPPGPGPVAAAAVRVAVTGDLFHGRVPDGAVYVGRAAPGLHRSPWANPHPARGTCPTCGASHDQAGAVRAYAADLAAHPDLAESATRELAGRDLACWCRTGPCHADVLLALASKRTATTPLDSAVPTSAVDAGGAARAGKRA